MRGFLHASFTPSFSHGPASSDGTDDPFRTPVIVAVLRTQDFTIQQHGHPVVPRRRWVVVHLSFFGGTRPIQVRAVVEIERPQMRTVSTVSTCDNAVPLGITMSIALLPINVVLL